MKSILPNSRKHDISFHASGKIDISAHIARKLSLAPGDIIDIAHENGDGIYTSNSAPATMSAGTMDECGQLLTVREHSVPAQKLWRRPCLPPQLLQVGSAVHVVLRLSETTSSTSQSYIAARYD